MYSEYLFTNLHSHSLESKSAGSFHSARPTLASGTSLYCTYISKVNHHFQSPTWKVAIRTMWTKIIGPLSSQRIPHMECCFCTARARKRNLRIFKYQVTCLGSTGEDYRKTAWRPLFSTLITGGHLDKEDFQDVLSRDTDNSLEGPALLVAASRIAAVRELYEETGIDLRSKLER